jgi:hypothetical protein
MTQSQAPYSLVLVNTCKRQHKHTHTHTLPTWYGRNALAYIGTSHIQDGAKQREAPTHSITYGI